MEERVIREAHEAHCHITPENHHISLLGQIHVSEEHENSRLEEEQQRHRCHVTSQRHQADNQCPKAENAKHSCH